MVGKVRMKSLATALLVTSLALPVSAATYKGANDKFNVTVEESYTASCPGFGAYSQKTMIEFAGGPIKNITVDELCANIGLDDNDTITVDGRKPTEAEKALVQDVLPKMVRFAWLQSKQEIMHQMMQKIKDRVDAEKRAIDDKVGPYTNAIRSMDVDRSMNGIQTSDGVTRYFAELRVHSPDFPIDDDFILQYAKNKAGKESFIIYRYTYGKPTKVTEYISNADDVLDGVFEFYPPTQIDGRYNFRNALKDLQDKKIEPRKPTDHESAIFQKLVDDLALGRVSFALDMLKDPLPAPGSMNTDRPRKPRI